MKKPLIVFLVSFVLFVSALGLAAGYVVVSFIKKAPSAEAQEVIYEVVPGKSFNAIASDLEAKGIVTNGQYFSWYARLTGQRAKLKVGEYAFRTNMVPTEVLAVLVSGRSIEKSFTISEGLNIYEIAALIESQGLGTKQDFLRIVKDPAFIQRVLGENVGSLEGYLFPETYRYNRYTTTEKLIENMVKRFLNVYGEVTANLSLPGWSRHQIVTLASIIEKETGAPEERPLISSVFHNRLKKKMRLQTDPTIIYGKAELTGVYEIRITREDLRTPTRYNTYTMAGLPPGPIANPGKEALRAVFEPAESEYLFFVSRNDGTHIFSKDYKDHNKAVQDFQKDPKARQGKSWRDLKNKTN